MWGGGSFLLFDRWRLCGGWGGGRGGGAASCCSTGDGSVGVGGWGGGSILLFDRWRLCGGWGGQLPVVRPLTALWGLGGGSSFLFRSGHPEHPGDKFYNTTVDVRPVRLHLAEQRGVLDRRQDSGADGRDERDSPTDSRAGGRDGRDSPTDSRDGGRDGEEPGASGDYHTVASFSAVSGVAEGKVDPHYGALESIRLLVHSDSQTWVILHTVSGGAATR